MFCNMPEVTPFAVSYKIKTNFRCQLNDALAFLEKIFHTKWAKTVSKGHWLTPHPMVTIISL